MQHKYLCQIEKKNKSFKVYSDDYDFVTKLVILELQINDYVKLLKYNSEFYNPMYRKGYFEEIVVHNFLRENGFTNEHNSYDIKLQTYSKPIKLSLTFSGLDCHEIENEVTIRFDGDGDWSWNNVTCKRDADIIIKTLNNLLHSFYLVHGSIAFAELSKFTAGNTEIISHEFKSNKILSESYNDKLIELLENQLKILKS